MAAPHANTWPPLVSSVSWDEQAQKQLYGQEVLASALFEASSTDEFYFPVDGLLSGFSADGVLYQNGAEVPAAERASWFQEEPGPFRGNDRAFPQRGLILVTDAGLSILSLENRYAMWMIALRGDALAYSHNFLNSVSGFKVTAVGYQNGRVVISMDSDPGSEFKAPVFIIIDFVRDKIYMERGTYRPPVIGPYTYDPVVYRVGTEVPQNRCAVDLVEGGQPTFWASYPPLPEGLRLDPETGTITGTPKEVASTRTYVVIAYNPGGEGATTITLTVNPAPPPGALRGGWVGAGDNIPSDWVDANEGGPPT